jgi:tetratricopeptide (TPR) repeat protein
VASVYGLQDSISERVAAALPLNLSGEERIRLSRHYTENTDAFQLYLRGRYFWNKRTEEGFEKGIDYFNQAIRDDPNYALAYAGMSDCYALLSDSGVMTPKEGFPKAKEAATRALAIDEKLAEAHTSLGRVKRDMTGTGPALSRNLSGRLSSTLTTQAPISGMQFI